MENIKERFLRYIAIDTRSNPESSTRPSTGKQMELLNLLKSELEEMKLSKIKLDERGYLYAKLPANDDSFPKIGFIAHVDTAPDIDGKCVNPRIFTYKGGDIKLNEEYTTKVSDFPFLKELEGEELIVTDGTTLLGADDKAGVAEIMAAVEFLVENPEIKHGQICVAFTSDEEIGTGADFFDIDEMDAEFAYTMDGGALGELEAENFNAASVKIKIKGKNVHPGSAKNVMIHAGSIVCELDSMIPQFERPQYTEGTEGFYMMTRAEMTVEEASVDYIIRDHDRQKFESKKSLLKEAVEFLKKKYSTEIEINISDSYYNMKEKLDSQKGVVDLAKKAMIEIGITPKIQAIRGGTDGARLSFMGLPCPNIFAGGYAFHGRNELLPTKNLEKARDTILKIIELSRDFEN